MFQKFSGLSLFFIAGLAWLPLFAQVSQRTAPTKATKEANLKVKAQLPFDNTDDFERATRGLLSPLDPQIVYIQDENGNPTQQKAWDISAFQFQAAVDGKYPPAPDTVNPSLWRVSLLNTINGVFEVVPGGIYQVRGQDLANMSAVVGESGWIIIDPLTTKETAAAGLANLNREYKKKFNKTLPVSKVIFTHSHVDHYGGVAGLVPEGGNLDDLTIYVPEGFFDEAVSENVIAGNVMGRRAVYMYGNLLPKSADNLVDAGLGKGVARGSTTLTAPESGSRRYNIMRDTVRSIDGLTVVFQSVPGSEAPAEMMFYFPKWKALCAAEDVTHTFHNVLTLRGANVRDPLKWSKYLDQTLKLFGDAQVVFSSHHWPTWNYDENNQPIGNQVQDLIEKQRDLYRYIHDQTMRLTNQGYTIQEVGEMVELPKPLAQTWAARDYYGTVNHNAKAVYQRYIGWFDGNPASLHQLPPTKASVKYIEYMGGLDSVLKRAKKDYGKGEYRWVAMVLNHAVFATADAYNKGGMSSKEKKKVDEVRHLLADTYDQLGYQAESGPWRNFYLTGALELRHGVPPLPPAQMITQNTVESMTLEMIFDFLAVHLDGLAAGNAQYDYTFNIDFMGSDDNATWFLKNGVLNYNLEGMAAQPTATLKMTRDTLNSLVLGDPAAKDGITVVPGTGGQTEVNNFWGAMDTYNFWFNIVTP